MSGTETQKQHEQDVKHIVKNISVGKSYELNLADDKQYDYVKTLYQLNGLTANRYPQTFNVLDQARQKDLATKSPEAAPTLNTSHIAAGTPGFGTLAKITSVGTAKSGTEACATAFLAVAGGVSVASLSLFVYDNTDPSNPKVLAQNTVNIGTSNFIPIQASGGTPTDKMYAMLTYSYTPVGGSPVPSNVITENNQNGQSDPTVGEPVQKPTHTSNANIRIALSRGDFGRNNDDVDYWFNKGEYADTTIIVPFVGSATFANPVDLSTLQLNLCVALQDGGASVTPSAPVDLSQYFTLSPDEKTLNWNFPANGATDGSKGNPIVYGTAPWISDTVTYFFGSIGINEKGSLNPQWIFIQSTEIADEVDNDGIEYIKPLVFLWHCVAEGTMITLADGSTKAIENVSNEDSVKINSKGDTMPVLATTLGKAQPGEIYILNTANGDALTLSSKHLVITNNGAKQAQELKAGDLIQTQEGIDTVKSIEKGTFNGNLYNLELGEDGNVPEKGSSFFANGVSVGDFQMQSHYHRAKATDTDYILATLPEEWHADYMSHLEDEKKSLVGTENPGLPEITAVIVEPIEHVANNFHVNVKFNSPTGFVPTDWQIMYASSSGATPTSIPVSSVSQTQFSIKATPGQGASLYMKNTSGTLKTSSYYVLGSTPKGEVKLDNNNLIEIDLSIDETNNFSGGRATLKDNASIIKTFNFDGVKGKLQLSDPISGDDFTITLYGTAQNGVCISPLVVIPVNTTTYDPVGVSYDESILTVSLRNPPASGEDVYVNIFTGDKQTNKAKLAFTSGSSDGTVKLPSTFHSWTKNTVETQVVSGSSYGPTSDAWEVLNSTPLLQSAFCSANFICVKWVLPPITSLVTRAVPTISDGGPATSNKSAWINDKYVLIDLNTPLTAKPDAFTLTLNASQGSSSGPTSNSVNVEFPIPTVLSAEYDGTTVKTSWSGVQEEITGYTIQLMAGSTINSTVTVPPGATSFDFKPTKTVQATDKLSIVITANFTMDIGAGLPSIAMDVSFTPGFFLGTEQASLYPISTHADLPIPAEGDAIKLYLPYGDYGVSTTGFVAPTATGTTYFTIDVESNRFVLTIEANTWSIPSNEIRAEIQSAYTDLLKGIEAKNTTFNAWGISVIQEAIARNMPQSFAESLYYSYGINLSSGSGNSPHADLRTGMILRVLPNAYNVVPGSDRGGEAYSYLDGYTNGAPIDYDISSYTEGGKRKLGFDAFISDLVSSGALTVDAPLTQNNPNVSGVATAADLYSPGFKNSFYRMFIPTTLLSSTSPGATQPQLQFNLVSASNYTDLEASTNPGSANKNTYFRGRSVLKLCIRIMVNENEIVVPIGTTVAQVLERYGQLTSKSKISLEGLTLKRSIGQSRISDSDNVSLTSYNVRFDYDALVDYPSEVSALDLPLLHGDVLTF